MLSEFVFKKCGGKGKRARSFTCKNYYLQTFLILVYRLTNVKECKLDKKPRNFGFYHILENLTVFEKLANSLGVPNLITKQGFHSFPVLLENSFIHL